MKVKIELVGQTNNIKALRTDIDKIVADHFTSFKFNWEQIQGVDIK